MGMDLALSPFTHHPSQWKWHLETARLPLDRDYRLFTQVSKKVMGTEEDVEQICKPKPLPPNVKFDAYEDEGIKTRKTDPYGEKLTYVLAEELAKLDLTGVSPWNRAVFAMMKQLPPDTPVILWWH